MALSIRWSQTAWDDVDQIVEFIAQDSPTYAVAFIRQARDLARSLKHYPNRGRMVPEISVAAIRELPLGSHRMIYRVSEDTVDVLGIVHGARDLTALLERERRPRS